MKTCSCSNLLYKGEDAQNTYTADARSARVGEADTSAGSRPARVTWMSEETAIDDIQKERAWMRAWVWLWNFLEKWTRVRFRSARESGEAGAGEGESSRGFRVAGSPLASPGMTLVGKKPLR